MVMARIHFKMNPLVLYLTALAMYSSLMMLASLSTTLEEEKGEGALKEPGRTQVTPLREIERMEELEEGEEAQQEEAQQQEEEGVFLKGLRNKRAHHERAWLRTLDDFYTRVGTLETACSKMASFGGTFCRGALDNNKVVCLDKDVALTPRHCTVYSFGIGADTTFDDQMSHFGCEVFMFDPTVNQQPIVSTNLDRETFHLLGLDVYNYNRTHHLEYVSEGRSEDVVGEYDTYDNIRKKLGHESRDIHYLKLDIENTEWRVLPYLVEGTRLAGVRQLAIEIHTMGIIGAPQEQVLGMLLKYWEVLEGLTRLGFLRAWYRPNVVLETLYHVPGENRTIPTCFEVLYLRRGPVY